MPNSNKLNKYIQQLLLKYATQVKYPKYKFNINTLYVSYINSILTPNTSFNKQFHEMIILSNEKEFLSQFIHREEYVDKFFTAFSKHGFHIHFYPNNEKNNIYKRTVLRSVKEKLKVERFVFIDKYNYYLKRSKEKDCFKRKLLEAFVMNSERGGYEESFDLKKELNECEDDNTNERNNNNEDNIYKENEEDKDGEVTQRNEIDHIFCINHNIHSKSFDNIEYLALYLNELELKRKEKITTNSNNAYINESNVNKRNETSVNSFHNSTVKGISLHLNKLNTPFSLNDIPLRNKSNNIKLKTTNDFISFSKNIREQQRRISRRDSIVKRIEKLNIVIPSICNNIVNTEPNQHIPTDIIKPFHLDDKHKQTSKKTLLKINYNPPVKSKYPSAGHFLMKLKLKEKTQNEKHNQLYHELVTHSPYYKQLKFKGIALPIKGNHMLTTNSNSKRNNKCLHKTVITSIANYQRLGNSIASKVAFNVNKPMRSTLETFGNKSNNTNNSNNHSMSYLIQKNKRIMLNKNNNNGHTVIDCKYQDNDSKKKKDMVVIYKNKHKINNAINRNNVNLNGVISVK